MKEDVFSTSEEEPLSEDEWEQFADEYSLHYNEQNFGSYDAGKKLTVEEVKKKVKFISFNDALKNNFDYSYCTRRDGFGFITGLQDEIESWGCWETMDILMRGPIESIPYMFFIEEEE